ncbi:MAG: penicillin acylase family protein [Acidobacteriia bacterium]|nr:penicillin acylase family protein [Terriglobia bacterium]
MSGTLSLEGLSSPVRIVRDRWGVPHIHAESRDDLFFAQGFVQAQDRLFQMDLWRRSVQGRLSQVLGANFIERDAMTRRVQYRGDLDAEWASYGPDAKAVATAFVRGVNAWVALARERPPEAFALAGWKPELWMPADLLNRTDLFVESRGAIDFSTWRPASAGPEAIDVLADALRRVGAPPFFVSLAADVKTVRLKPDTTNGADSRDAVRGVRLQPDQTRLDHPSRHYLIHLHAPGWNLIGATAPWMPGVAMGHDEHVAWDATSARVAAPAVDVVKVNPDTAHQIDEGGRWIDTVVVKDAVVVKGRTDPFVFESDYTARGVIIATERERHVAYVMRWRGVERGAVSALRALNADRSSLPPLRGVPSGSAGSGFSRTTDTSAVVFAHPLAISAGTRARFNIGPLTMPVPPAPTLRVGAGSTEWDHWTGMNAPGQSESPDSAHFKDLAAEWATGRSIPLPFSERAVESAAEATLILALRRR